MKEVLVQMADVRLERSFHRIHDQPPFPDPAKFGCVLKESAGLPAVYAPAAAGLLDGLIQFVRYLAVHQFSIHPVHLERLLLLRQCSGLDWTQTQDVTLLFQMIFASNPLQDAAFPNLLEQILQKWNLEKDQCLLQEEKKQIRCAHLKGLAASRKEAQSKVFPNSEEQDRHLAWALDQMERELPMPLLDETLRQRLEQADTPGGSLATDLSGTSAASFQNASLKLARIMEEALIQKDPDRLEVGITAAAHIHAALQCLDQRSSRRLQLEQERSTQTPAAFYEIEKARRQREYQVQKNELEQKEQQIAAALETVSAALSASIAPSDSMGLLYSSRQRVQYPARSLSSSHLHQPAVIPHVIDLPGHGVLEKSINALDAADQALLYELIHRNARRWQYQKERLRRSQIPHTLDVKTTIAEACRTGGCPVRLHYCSRQPSKVRILLLLDISGSCIHAAQIMLYTLHMMLTLFRKGCRSYAFVNSLHDISPLLQNPNPEKAIRAVFQTIPTRNVYSNYGPPLQTFWQMHRQELTRDSILVVIGDARNNYRKSKAGIFASMTARTRMTYWLNPEEPDLWNTGDSLASVYGAHCHMFPVTTPADLIQFLMSL